MSANGWKWGRRIPIVAAILSILLVPGAGPKSDADWIRAHGKPPADYVLAAFATHRVVAFGEAHWLRPEVRLVRALVPRLVDAGVTTLAVELYPASHQATLDSLLAAPEWREDLAMSVLRAGDWPYREYLDVLREAWTSNRARTDGKALRVLALGPGADWRAALAGTGKDYETFMSEAIVARLREDRGKLLFWAGLHHAFTRYRQTETTEDDRHALRAMRRTGNYLWELLGDRVFLIASHRPLRCRVDSLPGHLVPLDGTLDRAAAAAGGAPFAFDVAGSPWAERSLGDGILYGVGYPRLRLSDFTDGWIWFAPHERLEVAELIPLAEYAPDAASLAAVAARNPFDDRRDLSRAALDSLWSEQAERRRSAAAWYGWRFPGRAARR